MHGLDQKAGRLSGRESPADEAGTPCCCRERACPQRRLVEVLSRQALEGQRSAGKADMQRRGRFVAGNSRHEEHQMRCRLKQGPGPMTLGLCWGSWMAGSRRRPSQQALA